MDFISNLRTVKAFRGERLTIDLGKTFSGTLTAWMRRSPNSETYRSFDVEDNRYLVLPIEKTKDYYDVDNNLVEKIEGKWVFDVEIVFDMDTIEDKKTIYTGNILFINDITNNGGLN